MNKLQLIPQFQNPDKTNWNFN